MSKILKLSYNGEAGWNANISQVLRFYSIEQKVIDWLDLKDDIGISNRLKIFDAYNFRELYRNDIIDENKKTLKDEKSIDESFVMPWPIQIHCLSKDIPKDFIINQSNLLVNVDEFLSDNGDKGFSVNLNSFYENQKTFGNITNNDIFTTESYQFGINEDSVTKQNRNLKVWIWCKTLMDENGFNKNSVFDLTPFITAVTTNMTENGGTFSLSLAPIIGKMFCFVGDDGEKKPFGNWMPDKSSYVKSNFNGNDNFVFKSKINDLSKIESEEFKPDSEPYFQQNLYDGSIRINKTFKGADASFRYIRSELLFSNMISENDVIFISFRDDKKEIYEDDFFTSVDNIQNRYWDFIGLVDINSCSLTAESVDASISVSGRDLMKLLIEDGSFFFQKSYANPDSNASVFNNVDIPNSGDDVNALNRIVQEKQFKSVNRLITTGLIETLFIPQARNVGFIMNLLISRLANIEICPNEVFESYGDRRTRFQIPIDEYVNEFTNDEIKETE